MQNQRKSTIILVFLLFSFFQSISQQLPSFIKDSLDVYVNRAMNEWKIPGLAVCIIKGDQVVVLKGYGIKETGKSERVDENTVFMIGSNTKSMTATALALLQQEKKISLNDKVIKWLPDFKMKDSWINKEVTIRDLLSHRLGMESFQGDFMYWTSELSTNEVLEKFGQLTPMYGFRSTWGYTNAAFVVAGQLFPKITGKSWREFLKERIFDPLQMNSTVSSVNDLMRSGNKAMPHTLTTDQQLISIPYPQLDNLGAAAVISSSITDMSKWVMMLLNNGQYDGKEIIPQQAIDETRRPHSILGNGFHLFNKINFSLYGLGWRLEDYNGKKLVSHVGAVNGYYSTVAMLPDERLGVIILTNTDQNFFYQSLKWEIIDAFLGFPYRNYSDVFLKSANQQQARTKQAWKLLMDTVAMQPVTTLPITAYAGKYINDPYGSMVITKVNDHLLEARFEHHPKLVAKIEPLGADKFTCTYNDPAFGRRVVFFKTAEGKVVSMTLRLSDFIEFTNYEFIKNRP